MKAFLLSYTHNPEKVVAMAAKLCYTKSDIETLDMNMDESKAAEFIKNLMSMGHESPLEHASFTFAIEDVSRSLLAQITRHRIASFSVQSQRYVDMDGASYVVPPAIKDDAGALEVYAKATQLSYMAYDAIKRGLSEAYAKGGMNKKQADKKAQEDARFILPNSCSTKMIVTMNARELRHFFSVRCCNRAQWEIRELADAMLTLVKGVAPSLFDGAGPACVSKGICSEGAMSCGYPRVGDPF